MNDTSPVDFMRMIELINSRGYGTPDKIIWFVAIAEANRGGTAGVQECAWNEIEKLVGEEAASAFSYVIGYARPCRPDWSKLLEGML